MRHSDNPPSTLDGNKAKLSEVSNPKSSESFSRDDSSDRKSEDLKKESVNKTTVKEMTPEPDIKQKEASSTLNKDIENSSSKNSKSKLANIDWKRQYLQTKEDIEEISNEKSEVGEKKIKEIPKPKEEIWGENEGSKKINREKDIKTKSAREISDGKRKTIIEAGTIKDHVSLNKLSKEFDFSARKIRKILVKARGETWYREEYPSNKRISEKDKRELKENLEIPGDLFTKDKSFHCKNVEFIKKLYEEFKSYSEIERFFREQNTRIVPSQDVIKRMVRDSFESKEEYKIWKSNIYLKKCQEIARKKEGKCISEKYVNTKTPLEFECKEGHIFKMRLDVVKDHWCPECDFNERRLGLELFQEIARKKEGKCISKKYVNRHTPLEFECKEGHIFKMRPDVVKDHWCPECDSNKRRLGLELFQEIARKKEGKCISKKYVNNKILLEFECREGHIFKMRPDHVKEGYWCPECRKYVCQYGAPPEVIYKNVWFPKELKQHLKLIKRTKDFPKEVKDAVLSTTSGLINVSRISAFQITKIAFNERVDFEQELVNKGLIRVYNSDYLLCNLSNPKNFNKDDILRHGGVSHEAVLHHIINNDKNSVGIEIPVWLRNNSNMITGHIDLIRIDKNGTPYVIDYKPESFFHALPQVCIYGIVLKKMCNLEKLKCAIFNKDRMWKFDPELMLEKINKFLNSKGIDCYWNDYIHEKNYTI